MFACPGDGARAGSGRVRHVQQLVHDRVAAAVAAARDRLDRGGATFPSPSTKRSSRCTPTTWPTVRNWSAGSPSKSRSSAVWTTRHSIAHGVAATSGGGDDPRRRHLQPGVLELVSPRGQRRRGGVHLVLAGPTSRGSIRTPRARRRTWRSAWRRCWRRPSIGGPSPTALKNEYGARLTSPSSLERRDPADRPGRDERLERVVGEQRAVARVGARRRSRRGEYPDAAHLIAGRRRTSRSSRPASRR